MDHNSWNIYKQIFETVVLVIYKPSGKTLLWSQLDVSDSSPQIRFNVLNSFSLPRTLCYTMQYSAHPNTRYWIPEQMSSCFFSLYWIHFQFYLWWRSRLYTITKHLTFYKKEIRNGQQHPYNPYEAWRRSLI